MNLYRHKKTGNLYLALDVGRMQANSWRRPTGPDNDPWRHFGDVDMQEVVVYISLKDRSMWVRPKAEFMDGRFEAVVEDE